MEPTVSAAEMLAPAPPGDDGAAPLGHVVRRGFGLSLLNNALSRVGTVVSGIVVAHLLVPRDYGIFAVSLVVLNALLAINELGVSLAIVRWPGDPEPIAPTVLTLSVGSSAALYVAAFLAAPAVASLLGSPGSVTVIRVLSVSMLVDGASAVPAAMLTRRFQQGRRLVADMTALVLSTGITITMAVLGAGAYSLAAGYLTANVATSLIIWISVPTKPRFGWDRRTAGELITFGLPLAGASLIEFGVLNVDYIVVGSVLGPVALGFYTLAFNLSSWPVNVFSLAARRVAMPAFARLAGDEAKLRDGFARALALLMAATLPVCALLSVLAVPLVHLVYGARWAPSAGVLRWLAVLGAARVAAELAYDLLVATAHSRAVLVVQATWLAVLTPALYLGARHGGIHEVAFAHAAVAAVVVGPAFLLALSRAGVLSRALARYCARPVIATAALVAVALAARPLESRGAGQILVSGIAGGAVCLLILLPLVKLARPAR